MFAAATASLAAAVPALAPAEREAVLAVAKWLWSNPELGDGEFKAAERQTAFLRAHGFAVSEKYCGMATAYRAEFASPSAKGPVFAFCTEYDALPEVGHACGHNLNCGASLAAALMVKAAMEKGNAAGRMVLLGCPAEETRGGKIDMADAGALDGVDAIMMSHAVSGSKPIRDTGYAGARNVGVKYIGRGGSPVARCAPPAIRNPLDAQTLLYQAVGMRRHYSASDVAVAGTITKAGERSNMVPEESTSSYTVRSQSLARLEETAAELERMAKGAAMLAGVEAEVRISGRYKPTRPCFELCDAYLDAIAEFGLVGKKSHETEVMFAATDFGNFSQLKPGAHVHFPIMAEAACHSRDFAEACNRPAAYDSMFASGSAMAATALKFLRDADFRERVAAEFAKAER